MLYQPTPNGEPRQLSRASFAATIEALAVYGYRPTRTGSRQWGFRSRCPGHNGDNPESLAIGERDDSTPRLKCHAHDCDRRTILEPLGLWFEARLEAGAGSAPRRSAQRTSPPAAETKPDNRAAEIIAAAVAADATPAHAYLADRLVWPRTAMPLPASVRWLPANAAPRGVALLTTADGAAVYLFARPDKRADAVQTEALTSTGQHVPWTDRRGRHARWRRGFGERKGRVFEAAVGADSGSPTVLTEGPVSALAASFRHPGARCLAMGGGEFASFTPDGSDIVIEADGDPAGRKAALDALEIFPDAFLVARAAGDVADELAGDIGERAAIAEYDGGLERGEAESVAWREILLGGAP